MATIRATWGVEEKDTGLVVASGSAPTAGEATLEATRYALQYRQDGPVRYWVKLGRKKLVQGTLRSAAAAGGNTGLGLPGRLARA